MLLKLLEDTISLFYALDNMKSSIGDAGKQLKLNILKCGEKSLDDCGGKTFTENVDGKKVVKPESFQ